MIHGVDSNNFISKLKSIIIKHSFVGQILINAFERRILINCLHNILTQCFNYNQGPNGLFSTRVVFSSCIYKIDYFTIQT